MKLFRAVVISGLLLCLAPIASTAISAWIAARHGCRLHDGFIYPCLINGTDYGATLAGMNAMGWFTIFVIPLALILIILWTVLEIKARKRRPNAE